MEKPFVRFGYADRNLKLPNKRIVQSFISDLVKGETNRPCQLQYVFCSDRYLHTINLDYLQHDDYTDIITFDLSDDAVGLIKGEIYISVDRVVSNAKELGVGVQQEMLRVLFHGALHLSGYDDKSEDAKKDMRKREDFYLDKFGVL